MNVNITKVEIVVAVPLENADDVRNAICKAGAGVIGNYTCCSNSTKCVGTFKPTSKANPYIGEKNKLNFVNEEKLSVVCDISKVKEVIKVLKCVHPYEEPVIVIIPLIDESYFE